MASNEDSKQLYRWVLGENIVRFRAELASNSDPARRAWLQQRIQEHLESLREIDTDLTKD
jgi:hypothetical protein